MSKLNAGYGKTMSEYDAEIQAAMHRGDLAFVDIIDVAPKQNGSIKVETKTRQLPDFTAAVNRGAAWLDEIDPGWYREIDTSTLDLADEYSCVLGQSWNHYARANDLRETAGTRGGIRGFNRFKQKFGWANNTREPADYGFSLSGPVISWVNKTAAQNDTHGVAFVPVVWEHLTKTWLVLIQARQQADEEKRGALLTAIRNCDHDDLADLLLEAGINPNDIPAV